ncbi:MAG: GlsB/YeaQ/YmgE family stress response membrane protein [Chloroflexota bacterium]|nr:GlsB/YeaQ/YmgE family stress response membrane protein [Chloroflexota bacterium]
MVLEPGGIIAWIVVGLIAGWLAGVIMKGGGFGVVGDIVVGLVGALVGGFVFSLITGGGTAGFWGSIVVALIGAIILIAIVRALPGRSPV